MQTCSKISWNEVLETHLDSEQRKVLFAAKIGLAGAGGLGSNCATMLVRSGIRQLVIADMDIVAASNLNRQTYTAQQIGQSKVSALADNLQNIIPHEPLNLSLHHCALTPNNLDAIFYHCPLVIEAVDDPQTKAWLVQRLLQTGKTVVAASGMGGWGSTMHRKHLADGRLRLVGDFHSAVSSNKPPMAPSVTMVAAMQADEALCWLLGSATT